MVAKKRASKPRSLSSLLCFVFAMLATSVLAITGRYEFINIYDGPWLGYFTPAEELGEGHFWMAINGYNGEGQDWVVPSQPIKFGMSGTGPGISVEQWVYFHPNAITNNAFWRNPNVRSIYLPSSIKYIGYQAFADSESGYGNF